MKMTWIMTLLWNIGWDFIIYWLETPSFFSMFSQGCSILYSIPSWTTIPLLYHLNVTNVDGLRVVGQKLLMASPYHFITSFEAVFLLMLKDSIVCLLVLTLPPDALYIRSSSIDWMTRHFRLLTRFDTIAINYCYWYSVN